MLYPQNGGSFVTIDSVTSFHPVNTHRPTTSIIASHVHLDQTNLDTNGFKELRVTKWQLNHFFDLCQLLAAATNVIISHFIQCLFLFLITTTTHTHTFNGPLSRTTRVSRYKKGKTNVDFTEARDSEWQWHPLGHMQVCTSLQTDNHASNTPHSFLQPGCPSCRPTNSVKALKHTNNTLTVNITFGTNIQHAFNMRSRSLLY